jgi:branched-chain amino acid transport system ATP-binding protein
LLLDEPVAGLQPEMIGRIEDLISELVRSQKRTLFLIEHDIHFVLRVSETVIVMDDGKKIVEDEPGAIRKNRKILEAYLS